MPKQKKKAPPAIASAALCPAPEETAAPEKAAEPVKASPENAFLRSLDGEYGVWEDPAKNQKKKLRPTDLARYLLLAAAIFGFLFAGYLIFSQLYGYYQTRVVYEGLREIVKAEDPLAREHMAKNSDASPSLQISEVLSGKTVAPGGSATAQTAAQQNIISKLGQLKTVNPDLSAWIAIPGTVVDYPVMWTESKSYYLHRDFYGNYLASGTLYIDSRNSPNVWENRNTVIYGHNMYNGSMFASLHDFSSPNVFYNSRIEILTENGVYLYAPFSVHESLATDNYFETDFASDMDFIDFCIEMQMISVNSYETEFDKNSRILTLSTCTNSQSGGDRRWVVHALLINVIR